MNPTTRLARPPHLLFMTRPFFFRRCHCQLGVSRDVFRDTDNAALPVTGRIGSGGVVLRSSSLECRAAQSKMHATDRKASATNIAHTRAASSHALHFSLCTARCSVLLSRRVCVAPNPPALPATRIQICRGTTTPRSPPQPFCTRRTVARGRAFSLCGVHADGIVRSPSGLSRENDADVADAESRTAYQCGHIRAARGRPVSVMRDSAYTSSNEHDD